MLPHNRVGVIANTDAHDEAALWRALDTLLHETDRTDALKLNFWRGTGEA